MISLSPPLPTSYTLTLTYCSQLNSESVSFHVYQIWKIWNLQTFRIPTDCKKKLKLNRNGNIWSSFRKKNENKNRKRQLKNDKKRANFDDFKKDMIKSPTFLSQVLLIGLLALIIQWKSLDRNWTTFKKTRLIFYDDMNEEPQKKYILLVLWARYIFEGWHERKLLEVEIFGMISWINQF